MKVKLVKILKEIAGGIVKCLGTSKRLRQYPTGSAWYWNYNCMHRVLIKCNTIIIIYFETSHDQNSWFIVPSTHTDTDEICPNCLDFNLLIVNTCYVSLRSSSVCRDCFSLVLILRLQFNKIFPSFGTSQQGNTIIDAYTSLGFQL